MNYWKRGARYNSNCSISLNVPKKNIPKRKIEVYDLARLATKFYKFLIRLQASC